MTSPCTIAAVPASPETAPQAITVFGVSDIAVRSVKTLETGSFKAKVRKAARTRKTWSKDAVLVALNFPGSEVQGSKKIIKVRTPRSSGRKPPFPAPKPVTLTMPSLPALRLDLRHFVS